MIDLTGAAADGVDFGDGEAREREPLPALPAHAWTKHDQRIDPSADTWELTTRPEGGMEMLVRWGAVRGLTPRAVAVARRILAGRMSLYAASSTWNDYHSIRRLGEWYLATRERTDPPSLDWSHYDGRLARRFLAHGVENTKSAGNDFARIRDLYRYGLTALRLRDFRPDVVQELEDETAPGNAKGASVRAGDPEAGELTPPEVELIVAKLAKHRDRPTLRATAWVCLELGRNATQYVLIRNRDLSRETVTEQGVEKRVYQVAVRRMKKPTWADDLVRWPISAPLGDLLWSLREGGDDARLLHWLAGDTNRVGDTLDAWVKHVSLVSPRTGAPMHLNPRRFRVTLLTNAADEGASPQKLAALADHSDLQNVMVYIERSPAFLLRFSEKVDAIYDPLVRRFKGGLTDSTATTGPDGKPGRRIPGRAALLPMLDVGGIGFCGRGDVCGLAPPLTCYVCDKFVAFRDAPHERVVVALERKMQQMGDRVAVQLAPVLAAAREVIQVIADERAAVPA